MAWKRSLVTVVAVLARIPLGAVACRRSAESGGTAPPDSGLVTVTTARTRPAGSVAWAVYRDVTSLDPVYGSGYLENTADLLMCESLLRQTPDGAVVPGLASLPASIGGIVIERSFAQKQGQNQAARCFRNRARLDGLDTQVGFGDEPVAVELRGEPALVGA